MKNMLLNETTAKYSTIRRLLLLALAAIAYSCFPPLSQIAAAESAFSGTQKSCSACGRQVALTSQAGQSCPNCGAYWSDERTSFQARPYSRRNGSPARRATESRPRGETMMKITASSRKTWPRFSHSAIGFNHITFHNHTDSPVWIGFRSGSRGHDLHIAARGEGTASLPEGTFQVYVFRFDRPTELFETGSITTTERFGSVSRQTFCLQNDGE